MSRPAKRIIKWVVGIGVGALFIWLAALDWPLHHIFPTQLHINGWLLDAGSWQFNLLYIIPYLSILSIIHFLRVIRWAPLLRPIAKVEFWRLNRVSAVGFMYLFILPMRLGELARPYLIADRGDIKMSQALATVVVERIVDGLIVSLILFVVLVSVPLQEGAGLEEIRLGAYLALAVFSAAMAVLIAAYLKREWTLTTLRMLLGMFSEPIAQKIVGLVDTFLSGLDALPNRRYFMTFVFYSIVYWLLNGYGYYILSAGFVDLSLPVSAGYAMMCCVVVGMMLPNPPANVGVYWYFMLKPVALYGIAVGNPAVGAFALAAWLGQFVQQTAFGVFFLLKPKHREDLRFDGELANA